MIPGTRSARKCSREPLPIQEGDAEDRGRQEDGQDLLRAVGTGVIRAGLLLSAHLSPN